MAFKDIIKPLFVMLRKPTQGDFYSFFDKIWFKDEKLAITDITNLQSILNELASPVDPRQKTTSALIAFTYTIPVNYCLEKIIIKSPSDAVCSLSDDDGMIIEDDNFTAHKSKSWPLLEIIADGVDKDISITGVPNTSVITFIKRKTTATL